MESTATPPADSGQSLGNGALVRPSSDSEDAIQPVNEPNEPSPSSKTDAMDTRSDEASTGPPKDSNEISESANEPSMVSSSFSPDSRTSTLKYAQEPFDQFQVRIKALCHIIWPAECRAATLERRTSVAKARILDAVRIKKFRRLLSPSPEKEFIVERLAGGTYNRIAGIEVKGAGINDPKRFVLRVPRPEMAFFGHIEREAAIVRYVRQNTTLPVADVISFDATANNPLESGYVVQSRLPGVSLHSIWDELTHEQRCTAAQEIGKVILALQAVKNPIPGIIEASVADDGSQKFSVRPFDLKGPYDADWKTKISNHNSDEEIGTTTQTPLDWFGNQFGRWFAKELLSSPGQILYWDYQYQFVQVAKQMDSLDILGNGENCLCHFDLEARNVMVQIQPDGALSISGIVDWDSAAFAPKFVSCAPPSWLWTNQRYYDEDESQGSFEPSSPEQEEIKEAFEDTVGFDWTWLAYRPEYRLARDLYYFAQHGLHESEAHKKAVKLLKKWEALYISLMSPKKDDESSKGSPSSNEVEKDEAMDEAGKDGMSE
ncbi:hypothetical protein IMSHALPRED_010864 [Imshaugia aleurites]|uniref:Aminoglycoside phosphotransferase domain-containing protein n=1 Tax=Imshaugia aleurites TaxID=172621 RepID=A0A8H3G8T5_9LECA|nr:hypothetical protein IMSHALPRED_010864 [Imshaugia aleurites]